MLFWSEKNKYVLLPTEKIVPNPHQPRRIFEENALEALAESIRQNGVLQPILVQKEGGMFRLIAGERRLRAARMAGCRTIPAILTEHSEPDAAVLAIVENLQRSDLKPMEEAYALANLLQSSDATREEIAARLGISPSALSNKLRLLKLTAQEQAILTRSDLSERHARALLRLPAGEERLALLQRVIREELTVKETEAVIQTMLTHEKTTQPAKKSNRRELRRLPKDMRLFINTFDRAVASIREAGIDAAAERIETDTHIICTVKIPKAV